MASTYTPAGIELIGDGEQSTTWGNTTNTNWELVEELATGGVSIALTAATYTLTTTDGVTSNGRHAVVTFTGSPGATCVVTVSPNDMQKLYFIRNDSDETVTMKQGTGTTVDVESGKYRIVFCDGAGAGANVVEAANFSGVENLPDLGDVYTSLTTAARALLYWDDANNRWDAGDIDDVLPDQTSNSGKFLTTDGTNASWGAPSSLDLGNWTIEQDGTSLKFSYNGTAAFELTSGGAMTVLDDITAFGSI
jgi:hypothetical protein